MPMATPSPCSRRPRIAGPSLQGVAEGVAEIEQRRGHRFQTRRARHIRLGFDLVSMARVRSGPEFPKTPFHWLFSQSKNVASPRRPYLATSASRLASRARQSGKDVRIGDDETRLMKDANQVLTLRRVDAVFAADGAVDLGEQRRRDLYKRMPRRRMPAAKPARSPMTPPPNATTKSPRSRPISSRPSLTSSVVRSICGFRPRQHDRTGEAVFPPERGFQGREVVAGDVFISDDAAFALGRCAWR